MTNRLSTTVRGIGTAARIQSRILRLTGWESRRQLLRESVGRNTPIPSRYMRMRFPFGVPGKQKIVSELVTLDCVCNLVHSLLCLFLFHDRICLLFRKSLSDHVLNPKQLSFEVSRRKCVAVSSTRVWSVRYFCSFRKEGILTLQKNGYSTKIVEGGAAG